MSERAAEQQRRGRRSTSTVLRLDANTSGSRWTRGRSWRFAGLPGASFRTVGWLRAGLPLAPRTQQLRGAGSRGLPFAAAPRAVPGRVRSGRRAVLGAGRLSLACLAACEVSAVCCAAVVLCGGPARCEGRWVGRFEGIGWSGSRALRASRGGLFLVAQRMGPGGFLPGSGILIRSSESLGKGVRWGGVAGVRWPRGGARDRRLDALRRNGIARCDSLAAWVNATRGGGVGWLLCWLVRPTRPGAG
jgi:hypothetical protein